MWFFAKSLKKRPNDESIIVEKFFAPLSPDVAAKAECSFTLPSYKNFATKLLIRKVCPLNFP